MTLRFAPLLLLAAACASLPSQNAANVPPRTEAAREVMERPEVARAMELVDGERERIVAEWRRLTEIPAPSGSEAKRADAVAKLLADAGLDVRRDEAGNVMATRKGSGGGAHVVFDAHLDTVFAADTDVTTRVEGGRMHAPGVGDDTRNIAGLLATLRAMQAARVRTKGDLTFLFTVEEETTFKGAKQFLADHAGEIDSFVAFDGGYSGFTYGGIGIYWDRYHVLGPGGHTRSRTPPVSATLPLAQAIDALYRIRIPRDSWLNVGMLGAADVFNAKAADAWMSVDLRSEDAATLRRLDREVEAVVRRVAERHGMTVRRESVSRSEVAKLPGHRHSDMVRTVEGVWRAFGFDPEITESASNHASVAILAGIPAVSTGLAPCRASHSLSESCEIEPIFTGIKRNVALAVALTDLPPRRR